MDSITPITINAADLKEFETRDNENKALADEAENIALELGF